MDSSSIAQTLSGLQLLPILIAVLFVVVVCSAGALIYRKNQQPDTDQQVVDQVMDTFRSELDTSTKQKKKNQNVVKWEEFWQTRIIGSGLNIPGITRENVGKRMIEFFAVLFVLLLALLGGQVIGALALTVGVGVVITTILGFMSDKRRQKISSQVPGFLSSMRAGIQNNALPQNALLTAIRDSPDDLYKELRPLEQELQAGGSVTDTLKRFRDTTSIDELRFLMSCIILSIVTGNQSLDKQLGIIQGIIEARNRRRRHIDHAVSEVIPTITITSAVMPLLFLYMYLADATAKQFWFHSLFSWIMLILAVGIWWFGLYASKKRTDSVKKLG